MYDKSDCIKTLKFCSEYDTMKKLERQSTDIQKVFVNHINDKGLAFKMHKEL